MKVQVSFRRSKPQCPYLFETLAHQQQRKTNKAGKSSKKSQQPTSQGNLSKNHNSKVKTQNATKPKAAEKTDNNGIYDFQAFQAIVNSPLYQKLNYQYRIMKSQMQEISQGLKKDIVQLNRQLSREEIRLTGLTNLKNQLVNQVNDMVEVQSELRLKNYEMKCDLLAAGGQRGGPNYYDSQQHIAQDEQMDYEQMLELREQMGVVSVGYNDRTIKQMKGQLYEAIGQSEEKCCICYDELETESMVYRTECGHVHHLECLGRWLKVKRECPLCRCNIVLPDN